MSDTPREDYEIACEEACRELVQYMDNIREVAFEDSHAEEWGEDDDWHYWSATMVLKTDVRNRVYRIPVHCTSAVPGDVELGDSDSPCGDSREDVYRWMWIEETARP